MSDSKSLLGCDVPISRRDFIGTTLAASGAALLTGVPSVHAQGLDHQWTGFSGVGDYARSNGNTAPVVNAAHMIRDGAFDNGLPGNIIDNDETYDVVIVGGGFSGLGAAFALRNEHGDDHTCLILDNHPIFGGEAKGNAFDVDGYRIYGPQGSNDCGVPTGGFSAQLWRATGLPEEMNYVEPTGGAKDIHFATDNYGPMYWNDSKASIGYYFKNEMTDDKGEWHKDIWANDLADAPLSDKLKADFLKWRSFEPSLADEKQTEVAGAEVFQEQTRLVSASNAVRWLDTMTYDQYVTDVMKLDRTVSRYADQLLATGAFGLGGDVISAYGAQQIAMPGMAPQTLYEALQTSDFESFPMGNAGIARHIANYLFPGLFGDAPNFADILDRPINFGALERDGARMKMRLSSTVVHVAHAGSAENADVVHVVYQRDGKLYLVKARAVVMGCGGWVNRRVVRDMGEDHRQAFGSMHHAPILNVNVAVKNWRFMERLGISGAHWFGDRPGFFCNIRKPMQVGRGTMPLDPGKPAVLTFYMGFPQPGLAIEEQTSGGRNRLFNTSYTDFEHQIRMHLQELFGSAGFDARRDIAGIVLNRWGHAFICPQPGYYFGGPDQAAPPDVIRQPHGRISFGHSELRGHQNWVGAIEEGARALRSSLEMI